MALAFATTLQGVTQIFVREDTLISLHYDVIWEFLYSVDIHIFCGYALE